MVMGRLISIVLLGTVAIVTASVPSAEAFPGARPPEKRGCCSHHKGVCGCESGRTMCCDGTVSPTCECAT